MFSFDVRMILLTTFAVACSSHSFRCSLNGNMLPIRPRKSGSTKFILMLIIGDGPQSSRTLQRRRSQRRSKAFPSRSERGKGRGKTIFSFLFFDSPIFLHNAFHTTLTGGLYSHYTFSFARVLLSGASKAPWARPRLGEFGPSASDARRERASLRGGGERERGKGKLLEQKRF